MVWKEIHFQTIICGIYLCLNFGGVRFIKYVIETTSMKLLHHGKISASRKTVGSTSCSFMLLAPVEPIILWRVLELLIVFKSLRCFFPLSGVARGFISHPFQRYKPRVDFKPLSMDYSGSRNRCLGEKKPLKGNIYLVYNPYILPVWVIIIQYLPPFTYKPENPVDVCLVTTWKQTRRFHISQIFFSPLNNWMIGDENMILYTLPET